MSASPGPRDPHVLDFQVIRVPLDELIEATANKIRSEWPAHTPGNSPNKILLLLVKVAQIDYWSVRRLCDDKLAGYRLDYAASIPPLARAIADAVFTKTPGAGGLPLPHDGRDGRSATRGRQKKAIPWWPIPGRWRGTRRSPPSEEHSSST